MIISADKFNDRSPFYTNESGQRCWTHVPGDTYLVTGVDRSGKRFKRTTDCWGYAAGINLWRGTRWLVRGGKRFRIQAIYN